jgi:hypothetical protein
MLRVGLNSSEKYEAGNKAYRFNFVLTDRARESLLLVHLWKLPFTKNFSAKARSPSA